MKELVLDTVPDFAVHFAGTLVALVEAPFLEEIVKKCPPGHQLKIVHLPTDEEAAVDLDPVVSTRAYNKLAVQLSEWAVRLVALEKTAPAAPAAPTPAPTAPPAPTPSPAPEPPPAPAPAPAAPAPDRPLVQIGQVIKLRSGRKYVAQQVHKLPAGASIVDGLPHADGDFSYICGRDDCQCVKQNA